MPSLRTLDPHFRPMAERFFAWARAHNPGLVVTSARRTHEEQARLYNEYLAGRNDGLPAMPPGTSDHEWGLAFDMARPAVDPKLDPVLQFLGREWLRLGGRWGNVDPVHFAAPGRRRRAAGKSVWAHRRVRRRQEHRRSRRR